MAAAAAASPAGGAADVAAAEDGWGGGLVGVGPDAGLPAAFWKVSDGLRYTGPCYVAHEQVPCVLSHASRCRAACCVLEGV